MTVRLNLFGQTRLDARRPPMQKAWQIFLLRERTVVRRSPVAFWMSSNNFCSVSYGCIQAQATVSSIVVMLVQATVVMSSIRRLVSERHTSRSHAKHKDWVNVDNRTVQWGESFSLFSFVEGALDWNNRVFLESGTGYTSCLCYTIHSDLVRIQIWPTHGRSKNNISCRIRT